MALSPGARLGPYEILAAIGAGGMGEVYRARDTRLKRDVAIKILPDAFAQNPDRLSRFQREAELLATLSHQNIGAVFGLETADSSTAIVLELIDGETLAEQIARGPVPLDEALAIARQIAEALEAAHERGIIHRDLKPANIKITPDGQVKVLDFGLAKAMDPASSPVDMSRSPTLSSPLVTRMGTLLGTACYMSPEQAKGKPVDKRTDIWAFGCVLYEMLTRKRAFDGENVTDVLAAIVRDEPHWTLLPPATPVIIQKLLRRCLEKDRKRRFADIGDVRFEIDEAVRAPAQQGESVVQARGARKYRIGVLVLGAAVIGAVITGAVMRPAARQPARPVRRFALLLKNNEQFTSLTGRPMLAISPDARHLVYSSNQHLTLRALDKLDSRQLPGTDRAVVPFFSPDGEWIAFWQDGQLKKVAVSGGPPVTLCPWPNPFAGEWGPDGTILFIKGVEGVWSVPEGGGQATQVIKLDASKGESVGSLQWLPEDHGLLFTVSSSIGGQSDQARAESSQVVAQATYSSERKVLVKGATGGRYLSSGHVVFVRQGTLFAEPFDVDRLATIDNPIPVVEGVFDNRVQGSVNASGFAVSSQFSVSRDGVLAYMPATAPSLERTLTWVDRQGRETAIAAPARPYAYPRLSPDGSQIAVDVRDQENDIHIWDVSRQTLRRLTFDPNPDAAPLWTPEGQRVVYSAVGQGLLSRAADGSGSVEVLTRQGDFLHSPSSFSPDGQTLIFTQSKGDYDIHQLSLTGKHETAPLIQTSANEGNAVVSPDGKWIAYESNESGVTKIYVRPFPAVQDGRWEIASENATRPAWVSSREISYMMPGGTMMVVGVNTTKGFQLDNPTKLFSGPYLMTLTGRTYDVARDGQRFLMVKTASQQVTEVPSIILVENWFEELKQRVPVK